MITARARLVGAAVILLALGNAFGSAAAAGAASDKTATRLEVRLEAPAQRGLPHSIAVRLTAADGSAVTSAPVSVYLDVTFFGGRSALLGRATTDTSGTARVAIRPDRASYQVRARFAGNDTLEPSETAKTLAVPAAQVQPAAEPARAPLLVGVGRVAPRLIAVLVVLVWALLLGGSIWVLRRVRHHAPNLSIQGAGR